MKSFYLEGLWFLTTAALYKPLNKESHFKRRPNSLASTFSHITASTFIILNF